MTMNKARRKKLRDILKVIGTPEDLKQVDAAHAAKTLVTNRFDAIQKKFDTVTSTTDLKNLSNELRMAIEATRKDSMKMSQSMIRAHADSIGEFSDKLSKKLEELGGTLTTSYEKNKPVNAAGVYKDMLNQLSIIDKSIKDKPVPVWNWPQYASVGVRDTNFANVNPSIAPFAITAAFDEIQLTDYTGANVGTVTYLLKGDTVAVLSLTYSGDNLIDVTRTQ